LRRSEPHKGWGRGERVCKKTLTLGKSGEWGEIKKKKVNSNFHYQRGGRGEIEVSVSKLVGEKKLRGAVRRGGEKGLGGGKKGEKKGWVCSVGGACAGNVRNEDIKIIGNWESLREKKKKQWCPKSNGGFEGGEW